MIENVIAALVGRFERGAISRRELIQGLSVVALAAVPAEGGQSTGLRATGIGHLGVLCSDVNRSAAFYVSALGMSILSEDKPRGIARVGLKGTIISLRQAQPAGTVDHFALSLEGFDKASVTKALQQRGITTREDADSGFHVKDPDGANVQLTQ